MQDVRHHRPGVLVKLASVHQSGRFARQRLGRELVRLVDHERGADPERIHHRGRSPAACAVRVAVSKIALASPAYPAPTPDTVVSAHITARAKSRTLKIKITLEPC
jgi:hypothetical protein